MGDDLLAAGMILRRRDSGGDRWLLLHAVAHGEWGFPKGHAEPGEAPPATARRECAEECGIALLAVEGPPLELAYTVPDGRHKRVLMFPALTAQRRVRLSTEHDDHAWFDAAGVREHLAHLQLRDLFDRYREGLA